MDLQDAKKGENAQEVIEMHNWSMEDFCIYLDGQFATTCTTCKKGFEFPSLLAAHMSTHTGDYKYVCTEATCKKGFQFPSQLAAHMSTHTGD